MSRFPFLASAAILVSSAAWGQAPPKPVSRSDYIKVVDSRFNTADTNHDGFVSKAELIAQEQRDLEMAKAKVNQQLQLRFNQLDTNHDGKLTVQEFMALAPPLKTSETPEQVLARLDSNHDGKISAAEFRDPEVAKFNRVDANHDGIVTPQEQQAAAAHK